MLDGHGATLWSRTIPHTSGTLNPPSASIAEDGTIYVGGDFWGTLSLDDGATVISSSCEHCTQGYVAAYDEAGGLNWIWRTPEAAIAYQFRAVAAPYGVVVMGNLWLGAEPAPDALGVQESGGFDFVFGVDRAGNEIWLHRVYNVIDAVTGLEARAFVQEIAMGPDGVARLLVAYRVDAPGGLRVFYELVGLSSDGEEVWRRDVVGSVLAITDDGDMIAAGEFNRATAEQDDSYYAYVRRYDGATGDLEWSSSFGDGSSEQLDVSDIAIDPAGDVYVLGQLSEPVTIGPSALAVTGSSELFVAQLRGDDGAAVAGATLGIPGPDAGLSLVALAPGDLIICGEFAAELEVDGAIFVPDGTGVFIHRGNPFVSPSPFGPRSPDW